MSPRYLQSRHFRMTMASITFIVCLLNINCGIALASNWLDLSHDYSANTLYWPSAKAFRLENVYRGMTPKGYYYSANNYSAAEHGGTHVDAPIHFAKGGKTVDRIPLRQLMGQAIVLDVTKQVTANRDYLITVKDFMDWEAKYGMIPPRTIVLLRTGYEAYWPLPEKYLGTAQRGDAAVAKLHFPGLSEQAAKWLTSQRNVKAVGIDTASIDYGPSTLFKAHRVLAAANVPIFENVANLSQLSPNHVQVIALPMKIKGGSGAPTRIIAKNETKNISK